MSILKVGCELEFCARIWWLWLRNILPIPLAPPLWPFPWMAWPQLHFREASVYRLNLCLQSPSSHFQDLWYLVHIRSVVPKSRRRHLSPGSRHSKIQIRNLKSWVSGVGFRWEGVGSRWAHPMCTVDYTPCRGQGGIQKMRSSYPALKAVMRRGWMK